VIILHVLINCKIGEETNTEKLKKIGQVKDVFGTIGIHDIMVKLDTENFEKSEKLYRKTFKKQKKQERFNHSLEKTIKTMDLIN